MSAELVTEALKAFCPGGTGEKLVLVILANHTNSQTGLCFPSIPTIARQAGFSTDNAVYRHLRSLEFLGHITRISGGGRRSGGRVGNSNRYRVHPLRIMDDPSCGESSQVPEGEENNPLRSERVNSDTLSLEALNPLTPDVLTLSPERGEQEGTGNRTGKGRKAGTGLSKSEKKDHPGFAEFWSAYPKKEAKPKALQSWNKEKPDLEAVMKAMVWQKQSRKWLDGYIPMPSTYLNQRRWEDEKPNASVGGNSWTRSAQFSSNVLS